MRIILRGRHLNLGVCMWSRELISVCSTLFPTHKHLWLWVHLARSRSTRRTSHLALHSHIQSVPLPVWRIKRKCYFHTNSCNTVMEKNYLKNYLGSYFSDFNLIFVSYGYFPDPTWHQANSYLPTLLSTSDRLAPKWFWQNWASKEVLFSLSSSSEVFFFLVKKKNKQNNTTKKTNQNALTPFHYSVFNFSIFFSKTRNLDLRIPLC